MVELFIGGISISDRDSLRDLVEDAVLNTRSAAKNGVGYGANTMGYYVTTKLLSRNDDDPKTIFIHLLNQAYKETIKSLYRTIVNDDKCLEEILTNIITYGGKPLNMSPEDVSNLYDGKVLTSIESEPAILETIAKIVTIMFTANQVILQAPADIPFRLFL